MQKNDVHSSSFSSIQNPNQMLKIALHLYLFVTGLIFILESHLELQADIDFSNTLQA